MPSRRLDPRLDDPEWLRDQYAARTILDIASEVDCTPETVRRHLIRHGVPVRSKAEQAAFARRGELNDPDWLRDQYRDHSAMVIAEQLGVNYRQEDLGTPEHSRAPARTTPSSAPTSSCGFNAPQVCRNGRVRRSRLTVVLGGASRSAALRLYLFSPALRYSEWVRILSEEIIVQQRFRFGASVTVLVATTLMIAGAVALVGPDAGAGPGAQPGEIDATYVPIEPCRLFDLRPGHGGDRTAPLGPGEVYTQQVSGAVGDCAVPAHATGVTMNVTIVRPTARSYLTIYPADFTTVPDVSSLNWLAEQAPTPNAVSVKLSPDGKLKFFNFSGQVYVLADIVGYHTPTSLETLTAEIAQRTIPSGTTVTGNIVYQAQATASPFIDDVNFDLPGVAPLPLGNDDVNFSWNDLPANYDGDPTCAGTPEQPTAPPGKVCLYPSFTKNFDGDVETAGQATNGSLKDHGFGIGIVLDPVTVGSMVILRGSWAYTAP